MPTGIEGGIGIPHARSAHVTVPTLGFGRSPAGVDFGAADGPATLIFLIAAPAGGGSRTHDHPRLAGPAARARLLPAGAARRRRPAGRRRPRQQGGAGTMKIVAVTSCPTGIAHTYMAAEALEQAAKAAGHDILVETQGAAGATPLEPEQIAAADAVIFAADVPVRNRERFAGKPLVETSVKRAINDAPDPGHRGGAGRGERAGADAGIHVGRHRRRQGRRRTRRTPGRSRPAPPPRSSHGAGLGTRLRQWLMTGVSLHDPVRRGRRHPDRAGVHDRWRRGRHQGQRRHLRGRHLPRRRQEQRRHPRGQPRPDEGARPRRAGPASCSSSDRSRSRCWSPSWPASSPTRWSTGSAWCPASSRGLLAVGHRRRLPRRPGRRPARRRRGHAHHRRSRCPGRWRGDHAGRGHPAGVHRSSSASS